MNKNAQRGNAVVFILIAIALFAALAFTFMRGAKTGQGNLTAGQAKLGAQELIAKGNALEKGVDRLRQRGCSEMQISFANSIFATHGGVIQQGDGHNPNAPVSGECDLFKSAGANLTPDLIPDTYTVAWAGIGAGNTARGAQRLMRMRIPGLGDPASEELVYFVPYINYTLCQEINRLAGVVTPSGDVPETTNTTALFHGTFPGVGLVVDPGGYITGKTTFCVKHAGTTAAHEQVFMKVLLER